MKFEGRNNEYLEILEIDATNSSSILNSSLDELSLLWFVSEGNEMLIDSVPYTFNTNEIISLTEFHALELKNIISARLLRWNRGFYCIIDHDSEVSCKGILYYGASTVPVMKLSPSDVEILEAVYRMFLIEMRSTDNLQLEMLQMMLKRVLILCTRIYKSQNKTFDFDHSNHDIIREYNFLVEQHFKEKRSVQEYAQMLNRSPKTLSNLFKQSANMTPLQYIQNRIMIEARKLLIYSTKSISEIAYELGFEEVQDFSRFFKKKEACSPKTFREGKIAKS